MGLSPSEIRSPEALCRQRHRYASLLAPRRIGVFVTALIAALGGGQLAGAQTAVRPLAVEGQTEERTLLVARALGLSDSLGMGTGLLRVGDFLVVEDRKANRPFHLVDLGTEKYAASFGSWGRGPGEFQSVASLGRDPTRTSLFWAYDLSNRRITPVSLAGPTPLVLPELSVVMRADGEVPIELLRFGESWLGHGFLSAGRLAVYSNTGHFEGVRGALPPPKRGESPAPGHVRQQAYQSTFDVRPDSALIAVGTRFADRIDIMSPAGELLAEADRPLGFEPQYSVMTNGGRPVMGSGEAMRFGYIRVKATQDHIYALYSGASRAELPGAAHLGYTLRVFSWQGELQREFELSDPVLTIEVYGDLIYGIRHNPTPEIVVYRLPKRASQGRQ